MSWSEFIQHPNFPVWLLLLGIACGFLAAGLAWRRRLFFQRSKAATAHVASFNKRSAMEGNVWQVWVEFTDDQGLTHQLEYIGSGPYPPFAKAETLTVYYDPAYPKQAFAYAFWKVWGAALAIGFLGILITALGAAQLSIQF